MYAFSYCCFSSKSACKVEICNLNVLVKLYSTSTFTFIEAQLLVFVFLNQVYIYSYDPS